MKTKLFVLCLATTVVFSDDVRTFMKCTGHVSSFISFICLWSWVQIFKSLFDLAQIVTSCMSALWQSDMQKSGGNLKFNSMQWFKIFQVGAPTPQVWMQCQANILVNLSRKMHKDENKIDRDWESVSLAPLVEPQRNKHWNWMHYRILPSFQIIESELCGIKMLTFFYFKFPSEMLFSSGPFLCRFMKAQKIATSVSFSQTHKVSNVGLVANFIFSCTGFNSLWN